MRPLLCLLPLLLLSCSAPSQGSSPAANFSQLTLKAIGDMPTGGDYSGSDATKNKLTQACTIDNAGLAFAPRQAQPSFCSGATYLVFLKSLQAHGQLSPAVVKELVVSLDQKDGEGIFGRWNANGPGCAKLITDLNCGINFTSWEEAQPGDFLKIWWTDKIGGQERGHHVVYLGHDQDSVRFWSSNQPHGYGEKTVLRSKCKRVLFSRITSPRNISNVTRLPARDPWLERMLRDDFSWEEVRQKCRVRQ